MQGLWNGAIEVSNSFARWWNNLKIGGFEIDGYDIRGPGPNIPGFTVPEAHLPRLPTFHQGGVVPGRFGEEVLAVLKAGERVIPARSTMNPAAGGITITGPITIVANDIKEFERSLRQEVRSGGSARSTALAMRRQS